MAIRILLRIYLAFGLLVPAVAFAGDDLASLFQKEYAYLVSQKDSLERQIRESRERHRTRLQTLEKELQGLEASLAGAGARNDAIFTEVQELEKVNRELQNRDDSLKATLKKALRGLDEVERDLRFESGENGETPSPAAAAISDFKPVVARIRAALSASVSASEITGAYRDAQGELKEATLVRYGRIGAHAKGGSGVYVLGPAGDGVLAELDRIASAAVGLVPLYVFESLAEKAVVKKAPRWLDHLAALGPAVLLTGLFALVCGLFVVLVRE